MKNMKFYTALFLITIGSIVLSCNKDVSFSEQLTPLEPAKVDGNAGTWKLVFMTSATQVPLVAPLPVTDPTYVAELASIKDAQSKLSKAQRATIAYWSGGGILRWNEILRELVARDRKSVV